MALKEAGAGLLLLGFRHLQEEVEYFGQHVMPPVRDPEAGRRPLAIAA